jgi:hypothetical protein
MEDFLPSSVVAAQLPAVFFGALDERRYEEVAALMAENGIWHRQGKALTGPSGVLEAVEARPADFATAHIITNVIVEPSEGGAVVTFHSTVFTHKGDAQNPFPLVAPAQIGRYAARCAIENGSWKIVDLSNVVLFKAEDAR